MWPLISPATFWVPEYNPPSIWIAHAPFGFWLVEALKPKRIVELGVQNGFSLFCFCQAVKKAGIEGAEVHGVDSWKGDSHSGFYQDYVFDSVVEHNKRYEDFSHLHRTTFADAVQDFEDGSIDILHIDGEHYYESVKEDFLTWQPKLAEGAIVLLHDTQLHLTEPSAGINRFFKELSQFLPTLEFPHGAGLGVVCCSDQPPDNVLPIFTEDEKQRDWLQTVHAVLGRGLLEGRLERVTNAMVATNATLSDEARLMVF